MRCYVVMIVLFLGLIAMAPASTDLIDGNAGATSSARLKALGVAYWDGELRDDPLDALAFEVDWIGVRAIDAVTGGAQRDRAVGA